MPIAQLNLRGLPLADFVQALMERYVGWKESDERLARLGEAAEFLRLHQVPAHVEGRRLQLLSPKNDPLFDYAVVSLVVEDRVTARDGRSGWRHVAQDVLRSRNLPEDTPWRWRNTPKSYWFAAPGRSYGDYCRPLGERQTQLFALVEQEILQRHTKSAQGTASQGRL